MVKKKFNIACIGVTGSVGRQLLNILYQRNFPCEKIFAIASKSSADEKIDFGEDTELVIESLENFDFKQVDIVFGATSSTVAKSYVNKALEAGCLVIDNSSFFRKQRPLIVPEVNIKQIIEQNLVKKWSKGQGVLITSPNCIAAPLSMVLSPLHKNIAKVKRVIVSTYQAVAGAGLNGMRELMTQTKNDIMGSSDLEPKHFSRIIAFNLFPHIGSVDLETGATGEEQKIIYETNKLLDAKINISCTAVRVPTFLGHCASVNIEFTDDLQKLDLKAVINSLQNGSGVKICDLDEGKHDKCHCATPVDAAETDDVLISRIRIDSSIKNGLNLWFGVNCLRKGAALNSIQIAEEIINNL